MGYRTDFRLEIKGPSTAINNFYLDNPTIGYFPFDETWTETVKENTWTLHSKWYDHDKDMLDLSQQHPDLYFILTGVGEEVYENIWKLLYHSGSRYGGEAKIVNEIDDLVTKMLINNINKAMENRNG